MNRSQSAPGKMGWRWLLFTAFGFLGGFILGRLHHLNLGHTLLIGRDCSFATPTVSSASTTAANECCDDASINDVIWELNMRRARSYSGISVPLNNGYSAKCIPDATMSQMNVNFAKSKLTRSRLGLSDGLVHADDNILSEAQVGSYAAANMKLSDDGRPIWTNELWNYMQNKLDKGNDGGPPGYRNSGKSVMKGVTWALENILTSCGVGDAPCHMSVFSAISPWAEAIIFWSATKKLSRHNSRLTSVDFNPCILDGIPPNIIAECKSTLDLVKKPGSSFDLTVSYSGIEHDGLGRYGDPVNPDGDISALREMRLLTSPGGILLLAVPRADSKQQPKTSIPIWGNGKIQVLQHRAYGAERYMRLLVGWVLEGFVVDGNDVVKREPSETKIETLSRMLSCSFQTNEKQPLLILRKSGNMTFDEVLLEGDWNADKARKYEEEYLVAAKNQNATCS